MQIIRIETELPSAIADLARVASEEGVRNVCMLMDAWQNGSQRFDRDGAALFAAVDESALAGIGGVKCETDAGESAMRMHRFYVHPAYRRLGLGKRIARDVMSHALMHAPLLTCNARASEAAEPFWLSLGFARVDSASYTHIFRIRTNTDAWQPCAISHNNCN